MNPLPPANNPKRLDNDVASDRGWSVRSCANCGVLWVEGWCSECNYQNVQPVGPDGGPQGLCPACSLLGQAELSLDDPTRVSVACTACGSHFFWPQREQQEFLRTQERRWVARYCRQCSRQREARQTEDLRALEQAAQSLADAYRVLKPGLKDPEKIALRFQRAQQRAAWIVSSYSGYLPPDSTYRFQASLGQPYPNSPFDDSVPSKRAILRLRQATKELLKLVEISLRDGASPEEAW